MLLPAGCQTTASSGSPESACHAFEPITWSDKDTRPTVRQVVAHNAVGKAVCGWVPAATGAAKK